jgi:AcrR family transcriptional regulator
MANLREAQKEMTRQLLLTTSLKCFENKGYAATTIDDIVRAAGATRTTFYLHFASRTELMRALLEEVYAKLQNGDEPEHSWTSSELVEVVRNGQRAEIADYLRATSGLWKAMRPYVNAAYEAAAIDPEIRAIVDDWMESAADDIERGLTLAGRFDPTTRHIRAVLAFSQLEYLSRRWMRSGWDLKREKTLELLAQSWTDLLCD